MNQLGQLARTFRKTPVLVIDADSETAYLTTHAELLQQSMESQDGDPRIVSYADKSLAKFRSLVGDDTMQFGPALISQITNLPYARIDGWLRSGLIKASLNQSTGVGHERRFSMTDAYAVCLLAALRRQGCPIPMLHKVAAIVRAACEPAGSANTPVKQEQMAELSAMPVV